MKHFGKMQMIEWATEPVYMFQTEEQEERGDPKIVAIPSRKYQRLAIEDGTPWFDVQKKLKPGDDIWFIVTDETGWVMGCERDPDQIVGPPGYDLWQIKHPGGEWDIRRHIWNGKAIVDDPDQP